MTRSVHPGSAWAPIGLVVTGLALEAMWLALGTLSAWVTTVPAVTVWLAGMPPWGTFIGMQSPQLGPPPVASDSPAAPIAAEIAFIALLGLTCVGYLVALAVVARVSPDQGCARWIVVGFAVLFQLTTMWAPGVLSGDAILYATFGRLAGVIGVDPNVQAAAWPGFDQVDASWWWYRPTLYGPTWTDLSALVALATQGLRPIEQVFAFKVIASLAFLACLLGIGWVQPRLARLEPGTYSRSGQLLSVMLFGWNPLVQFETGQGHNDSFLGALLLAALVPLVRYGFWARERRGAWPWSFAILTLDTLVKYLPVFTGLFLAVVSLRLLPGRAQRVRAAALLAGIAVLVLSVTAWPFRDSTAVLQTIGGATAGGNMYVNSIVDIPAFPFVARYLDKGGEHLPQSLALVRFWEQVVVRTLLSAYVLWEARRLWRGASTYIPEALSASMRVSILVIIFALTQTLDYYFISPLVLAATLGWRDRWTRVCVALTVLYLPVFYLRRMDLEPVHNLFLVLTLLGPLIAGIMVGTGGFRDRCRSSIGWPDQSA